MRVAVVIFQGRAQDRKKVLNIANALASGIAEGGHQVDVIDGDRDVSSKLTGYQYVAVGAASISTMGGKVSENVARFLRNAGLVSGKRSFAFVVKGGLRVSKTLSSVMKTMEHEGMYLKYSEILSTAAESKVIGLRLHIE